jgi:hypothetical protein
MTVIVLGDARLHELRRSDSKCLRLELGQFAAVEEDVRDPQGAQCRERCPDALV